MTRVLRWLGRMWRAVALAGAMLIGLLAPAFAEGAPVAPQGPPTPAQAALAKQRGREGRAVLIAGTLYQAVLLGGFLLLGGTRRLAALTRRFGARWWLGAGAVVGLVSVGLAVLTLPVDLVSGYLLPHRWGLSHQSLGAWLGEAALGGLISLVIGVPIAVLGYLLLRKAPRTWPIWAAVVSVPLMILGMLVYPTIISPLFNRFTPLPEGPLRSDILAMAHAQGIPAKDVYQMDASRQGAWVNAYVVGFGPTHRIVLYDTLLQQFTPAETQFILAHEMGHYKLGHIQRGIIIGALGTLVGGMFVMLAGGALLRRFGDRLDVHALGDPAGYPLLLALGMALSLLATPIVSAVSRTAELEADRFAAQIDPDHAAGISAFHRLAILNISDEDPPAWAHWYYGTHPTIKERVEALRR